MKKSKDITVPYKNQGDSFSGDRKVGGGWDGTDCGSGKVLFLELDVHFRLFSKHCIFNPSTSMYISQFKSL
jgi:hypothetical protein